MPSIKYYRIQFFTKIGALLDEVTLYDGKLATLISEAVAENGFGVILSAVYTDGTERIWKDYINKEV